MIESLREDYVKADICSVKTGAWRGPGTRGQVRAEERPAQSPGSQTGQGGSTLRRSLNLVTRLPALSDVLACAETCPKSHEMSFILSYILF